MEGQFFSSISWGLHGVVLLGLGLVILSADKGLSICRNTRKLMMLEIAADDTAALFCPLD
jgi:hypothetical protein